LKQALQNFFLRYNVIQPDSTISALELPVLVLPLIIITLTRQHSDMAGGPWKEHMACKNPAPTMLEHFHGTRS